MAICQAYWRSSAKVNCWSAAHSIQTGTLHPPKSNRKDPICFSPHLYKTHDLIERFFNKIKQFRRIATRYGKLPENYLAALKPVAIRIWLGAEFAA